MVSFFRLLELRGDQLTHLELRNVDELNLNAILLVNIKHFWPRKTKGKKEKRKERQKERKKIKILSHV